MHSYCNIDVHIRNTIVKRCYLYHGHLSQYTAHLIIKIHNKNSSTVTIFYIMLDLLWDKDFLRTIVISSMFFPIDITINTDFLGLQSTSVTLNSTAQSTNCPNVNFILQTTCDKFQYGE